VTRFTSKSRWHAFCVIDFSAPKAHPAPVGRAGFKTPAPLALTGYPQAKSLFGSEKRTILAVERLQDSLHALTGKVDALESASRKLELEWVETYDKIRHQMSRMARRGDLRKGKGEDEIVEPGPNDEAVVDPISAGIHARRNRSFLGRQ